MKEAEKIGNTEVLYAHEISAYRRRKLSIRIPLFIRFTNCHELIFFNVLIFRNLLLFIVCCSQF